ISKADLFSPPDRERLIDYVRTNVQRQLGATPSVDAISVLGHDAALCDRWFEKELRPLLAQHRELLLTSQKRKIGALRDAVVAALERRLHIGSEASSEIALMPIPDVAEALGNADMILERAQGEAFFLTSKITKAKPDIIDAAAPAIAIALLESETPNVSEIFGATVTDILSKPVASVLRAVEEMRDALQRALRIGAANGPTFAAEELPKPTGMPALDVAEFSKRIQIDKPAVLSLLGKTALTG